MSRLELLAVAVLGVIASATRADPPGSGLEEIVVSGRELNLVGEALSASHGVIGQAELQLRPILRTGELLEAVPGLVATQHSGTGKANQYFLRGFNLDHGTDFSTSYESMPVNMRTHGHGQGYTDLNFVIPELVQQIEYRKGTYYADVGDFSGAGAARITPFARLGHGQLEAGIGEDGYYRLLALDSIGARDGDWLYALELNRYDGPWTDIQEDVQKLNATLRRTWDTGDNRFSLMAMGYDNSWNSADQIPRRAVDSGLIDERGSIDTDLGGESSRYSLSGTWESAHWNASLYAIRYDLDLWSNFTYELDDPVNGDQFQQVDERAVYGGELAYRLDGALIGARVHNTLGLQWRHDDIDEVGLYRTVVRHEVGVIRSDAVEQSSVALFWQNEIHWSDRLRSVVGARADRYDFSVDAPDAVNINGVALAGNGGTEDDAIASLKGSLVRALGEHAEIYASAGQGFHSNDARGTTTRLDPSSGEAVDPVDPLVRSLGAEIGARLFEAGKWNASISLWQLELDSELVFVGDAGTTEPSRESERKGAELTAYYHFGGAWTLDLEYAVADAQFTSADPSDPALGDEVPGSIDRVFAAGLSARLGEGWFGSLRLRHFGPRALEESGDVESDSSTVLNLRAGYELERWRVTLDVLNLLDSDDHDIDYFYESQLRGESEPVADLHYHVMEPRTLRLYAGYRF
ncbi:MAG: TonB-dependent receptor [Gammaproteobacteria bacterium]|nr:TonB-dependent receptor [Gammaproteobacteria bacterium]